MGWRVGGIPGRVRRQLLFLMVMRVCVSYERTATGRRHWVHRRRVLVMAAVHLGSWVVRVVECQIRRWVVRGNRPVPWCGRGTVVVRMVRFSRGVEIQWLQGPTRCLPQVVWVMRWRSSWRHSIRTLWERGPLGRDKRHSRGWCDGLVRIVVLACGETQVFRLRAQVLRFRVIICHICNRKKLHC